MQSAVQVVFSHNNGEPTSSTETLYQVESDEVLISSLLKT